MPETTASDTTIATRETDRETEKTEFAETTEQMTASIVYDTTVYERIQQLTEPETDETLESAITQRITVSDNGTEVITDPSLSSLSARSPELIAGVVCGVSVACLLIVLVTTVALLGHCHRKHAVITTSTQPQVELLSNQAYVTATEVKSLDCNMSRSTSATLTQNPASLHRIDLIRSSLECHCHTSHACSGGSHLVLATKPFQLSIDSFQCVLKFPVLASYPMHGFHSRYLL